MKTGREKCNTDKVLAIYTHLREAESRSLRRGSPYFRDEPPLDRESLPSSILAVAVGFRFLSSAARNQTFSYESRAAQPLSIVENGKWIDLIRRSGEKSRGEEIRIRSEASTWIWKEMSCDQNWRDERKIIKVIFLLRLRDFYSIFFSNWETGGVSYRE